MLKFEEKKSASFRTILISDFSQQRLITGSSAKQYLYRKIIPARPILG
jgi:hypothetical protein